MKKSIILSLFLLFPGVVFAQETACPYGYVNEPSPGTCVRYVDSDGNDICDLSQIPLNIQSSQIAYTENSSAGYISEEELKHKTVSEMAVIYGVDEARLVQTLTDYLGITVRGSDSLETLHDANGLCSGVAASLAVGLQGTSGEAVVEEHDFISKEDLKAMTVEEIAGVYSINPIAYASALESFYKTDIRPTDSFQLLHDNVGLEPSQAKEIASDMAGSALDSPAANVFPAPTVEPKGYRFFSIIFIVTILYVNTLLLSRKKVISVLLHKRIWNFLLLLSFLVSGLLGVLLIIRVNYGYAPRLPFNILSWHVEASMVMVVISVFHVIEHRLFYTVMFKRPGIKRVDDK